MLNFYVDKKCLTKILNQIKANVPANDTFEDEKYCCHWDGVYYKDYE